MTTDTEYKSWDEMTPEEQTEFTARSKRQTAIHNYAQYQEIIDTVYETYETGLSHEELVEFVAGWVYDERERVADEREEELKAEPNQAVSEMVSAEGWEEKEEEEEDEE